LATPPLKQVMLNIRQML